MVDASNSEVAHKPKKKRLHCWISLECYLQLNAMAESASSPDKKFGIGWAVEDMCRQQKQWAERGDMAARILKSSLPEQEKVEAVKPIIGAQ